MTSAAATSDFHNTRHNFLSFSQLSDFQKCRYRWSLRYHHGLVSKTTARPLQLGDLVHQLIADGLVNPGNDMQAYVDNWKGERYGQVDEEKELDQLHEIGHAAPPIARQALARLIEMGWEPMYIDGRPAVEIDFKVPIPGFDGFIVHVDAVFYDRPNNTLRVADYKVRKAFQDEAAEAMNLQHAIYQYVLRKNGIPVSSSATIQLKNEPPKRPSLNKNGTMSKAAIATDWGTYRAALIEAGLDPNDYPDMQAKLSLYEPSRVSLSYRTDKELDNVWSTIVLPTANEIVGIRESLNADPTYTPVRSLYWQGHCQNCNFLSFCQSNLAGYDTTPMLNLFGRIGA